MELCEDDEIFECAEKIDEIRDVRLLPEIIQLASHRDAYIRETVATPIFHMLDASCIPVLFQIVDLGRSENQDCDIVVALLICAAQMWPIEARAQILQCGEQFPYWSNWLMEFIT